MNNKIENQKYIINRLDNYIESSQTKSNLYLTLNTIILAGIITLISAKINSFNIVLNILLGIISIISLISIIQTLKVINPYLKKSSNGNKSILFFNDIESINNNEYYKNVCEKSKESLLEDLTEQSHILAKGLNRKYKILSTIGWLIGTEFFLLFIWILLFLITKN